MEAFGEVAVRSAELMRGGASAREAWETAARAAFPHSRSLREKSCPRVAFVGLCEAGLVAGVPAGAPTKARANKEYAVRAAELLAADPGLAESKPRVLWDRVLGGGSKRHNSQMDVVLALHRKGLLSGGQ
jgi:hypothetical protein